MALEDTSWRQLIVNQLQKRNHCETNAFRELILLNHRLFDNVNKLKNENLQLTLQNERIRVSGYESSQLANGNNDGQPTLEQRLLAQQEELTALHRRRGENAQEIITLNAKLHEAEKKLAAKDSSLSESCAINASLRAEIQMYENNMQELQGLNQMLRDEHQALQIAFSSLEEKLRKCQDENRQLVERLIKYKATDADKMNEENETYIKSSNPSAFFIQKFSRVSFGRKGERMRKELEEAARDGGTKSSSSGGGASANNDDKYMEGVPFFASVLPTKVALRFDAHDGDVNAVRWSPTDRLIATGGADRKVKLWDVSKVGVCEKKGTLVGSNAGVMSVDFDSTGTLILASSNDFASRVWSVADQRLRHTLTGHSGKVMAAKFLGELTKVISGSHDRTIKIWDLRSRACIVTKFVGSSCNDLVTADGAGSTIISGHYDKRVRFWDARTDTSSHDILLHGRITSLDLSRDCNYLLACVRDDSIQLIDLRNSAIVRQFSHDGFKVGCDWARASFSPGGRLVAAGGVDGGVYIWSTHSGKLEAVLREHSCAVTAVAWQPHAGLLASVDRGKSAIVWGDV